MTKADHYPVKKRGQKRTLNPNRDAIRWLENEAHDDTEISQVYSLGAGLNCVRAQGFVKATGRGYPRRMFDIFSLEASSALPSSRTPCEACDDFSRTWACAEHPPSGPPSLRTTDLDVRLSPDFTDLFARPGPGEVGGAMGDPFQLASAWSDCLSATLTGTWTLEITDGTAETLVRIEAERDGNA